MVGRHFAANRTAGSGAADARSAQDANLHLVLVRRWMRRAAFSETTRWAVMLGKRAPVEDLASISTSPHGHEESFGGAAGAPRLLEAGMATCRHPGRFPSASPRWPHGASRWRISTRGRRDDISQAGCSRRSADVRSGIYRTSSSRRSTVGSLWQVNRISVARKICTADTKFIMSALYPQILAAEKGAGPWWNV